MTIGFFIPLAWHWHWPKLWPIVSGAIDSARLRGATVYIVGDTTPSDHLDSAESEIAFPQQMQRVDGYIFAFPNATLMRYAKTLHDRGTPVMVIGRRAGEAPRVICNNFEAIRFATTQFIQRGHRRIAFISGASDNLCAEERLRGYRQGLGDGGLVFDEQLVVQGDLSQSLTYTEILNRVRAGLDATAIIATNDLTAIGAIQALQDAGKRVPEDVEVTGFDNVPRSHWAAPAISTFDMQAYQLGFVAAQDLLRKVRGENIPIETAITLPYVPRASTREPLDRRSPAQRFTSEWTEGEFFCARQIQRLRSDRRGSDLLDRLATLQISDEEFIAVLRGLLAVASRVGVGASSLYPLVGCAAGRSPETPLHTVLPVFEIVSAAAVDEQKKQLETGIVFAAATLSLRELSFESVEQEVVISRLRETLRSLGVARAGLFLQAVGSIAPFPSEQGSWWNLMSSEAARSMAQPDMDDLVGPDECVSAFLILPLHHRSREFGQIVLDASSPFLIHFPDLMGQLSAAMHGARMRLALAKANCELDDARIEAEKVNEQLAKSYEALRSSEYFYHSLVESLPQFIVRKDPSGRFSYVNSAFAKAMGRTIEEIIGRFGPDVYPTELAKRDAADDAQVMKSAQPLEFETAVEYGGQRRNLHVKKTPIFGEDSAFLGVQTLYWDMTIFRETEEQLKRTQRELVEASRLAGIAEMATGVLHNIGNALNSVNTSASLAAERMRDSKIPNLTRVAEMLEQNKTRLPEFLASDPRGSRLVDYLSRLAECLRTEQSNALQEFNGLSEKIEHLNQIVAAQQSYANVAAITELTEAEELLEYALRLSDAALNRHQINLVKRFKSGGTVRIQRQKALQILVNLINNAKDAMLSRVPGDRELSLGAERLADGRVRITVADNGGGIAQENLTRIFGFGFTTKKSGHGYGLHSAALAAKEMKGSLTAESAGVGKGAAFILELPGGDQEPSGTDSTQPVSAHVAAR